MGDIARNRALWTMRHRLPVRPAGPAGRPTGRRGPHPGAAGHRGPLPAALWAGVPLIEANAEQVPLADGSFDLVVSEYGASVWCAPERWMAEAARLLRPGGRLVFLTNSVLATLGIPEQEGVAQERLLRPQRALHRVEWPGGGVEFHPSHGDWIRVLGANGFVVQALHELYAPADAATHQYYASPPPNGPASGRWRTSGPHSSRLDQRRHLRGG
jgi:SAM-dependent methyltransferase